MMEPNSDGSTTVHQFLVAEPNEGLAGEPASAATDSRAADRAHSLRRLFPATRPCGKASPSHVQTLPLPGHDRRRFNDPGVGPMDLAQPVSSPSRSSGEPPSQAV